MTVFVTKRIASQKFILIFCILFNLVFLSFGFSQERILEKSVIIRATLKEAWDVWTTMKGMGEFFTPNGNIRIEKGVPHKLYLIDGAPEGQRGSDGCRVLSYLPMKMLSFEWGIPPKFKELRAKYQTQTRKVLLFNDIGEGKIKVTLHHLGFDNGKDWDEAYAYFDNAWDYVLDRLRTRFEKGPLDWHKN
jgi:uncharacterized protein YndB with AHSA1/START domain